MKNISGSVKRVINFLVDLIVIFLLTVLVLNWIIYPFTGKMDNNKLLVEILVFIFIYFEYYGILEYKFQKTIGKFITKTKVVKKDGTRLRLNDIFIRTAGRLIFPIDQISFLFKYNGLHDSLSRTTLIKED